MYYFHFKEKPKLPVAEKIFLEEIVKYDNTIELEE
jgi:hypothetical protein